MARGWEGSAYHRVAAPQESWNAGVLERLAPRGDERVLDAGCGSGRGTAALIELLPRGEVVAVDASSSMIEQARENLGDRASVILCDLCELTPEIAGASCDAVVSTATFHWISDQRLLFERLAAVLRPGGRLETDSGGAGNVQTTVDALAEVERDPLYADHFAGWRHPWHFATPAETVPRLEAAGFAVDDCWLTERPAKSEDPREFVRVVQIGQHLERLPPELREPFTDAVMERLGPDPEFPYVRLNISARKRA